MPEVKVLPVPEGSIVWLHNIDLDDDTPEGDAFGERLHRALHETVGHDRYVVLCTRGDGVVDVLGPDDLVERVRTALEATP